MTLKYSKFEDDEFAYNALISAHQRMIGALTKHKLCVSTTQICGYDYWVTFKDNTPVLWRTTRDASESTFDGLEAQAADDIEGIEVEELNEIRVAMEVWLKQPTFKPLHPCYPRSDILARAYSSPPV
tara:strand:- start:309 stop:689 length:381 start_codon:yes stop_codon:yes gene_type:complete